MMKNSPLHVLEPLRGMVILDEIQRMPELFPLLRVLADRNDTPARFLILGSASPHLIKNVSESLAGRVGFVDMAGFNCWEVAPESEQVLWFRGGFPKAFLAKDEQSSFAWRSDFIRTFLERDVPQLGINIPSEMLRRFWTMLAHYHGQTWNGSEFARSLGITEPTARRYLDILSGAYVVRQIQPWHENIGKRQVKAPKIYIRDSGLLHALLMLKGDSILSHPKAGASWEGFVLEQIISRLDSSFYYWATHAGAELDLFTESNGIRTGVEVKLSDAPAPTKSMYHALHDLRLDRMAVIYPGKRRYALAEKITVIPLREAAEFLELTPLPRD